MKTFVNTCSVLVVRSALNGVIKGSREANLLNPHGDISYIFSLEDSGQTQRMSDLPAGWPASSAIKAKARGCWGAGPERMGVRSGLVTYGQWVVAKCPLPLASVSSSENWRCQ